VERENERRKRFYDSQQLLGTPTYCLVCILLHAVQGWKTIMILKIFLKNPFYLNHIFLNLNRFFISIGFFYTKFACQNICCIHSIKVVHWSAEKKYLHTKYIQIKTTLIVISLSFKAISWLPVWFHSGVFGRPVATFKHEEAVVSSFLVV